MKKNTLAKSKIAGLIFLNLFFVVGITQAAGIVPCGGTGQADCKITDMVLIVVRLINYLLSLSGFVAMVFIVWAGWGMFTSGGNEEKITAAKETLSNAIIGFFLVIVAFLLLDAIIAILSGFTLPQVLRIIMSGP